MYSFIESPLLGSWHVTWYSGSTATYTFQRQQQGSGVIMKVLSCSWNRCKNNIEKRVEPSSLEKYSAHDGWFKVRNIHYTPVVIYVRRTSNTSLGLRWWKGHDKGAGNGSMIGKFEETLIMKYIYFLKASNRITFDLKMWHYDIAIIESRES